jgi:hypothetical protein
MTWINRIICALFGHRPYFEEIGGAGFHFCERCDMEGELLYDLFNGPTIPAAEHRSTAG